MKYEIDIFHYIGIYKKEWKRMVFLIGVAMVIAAMIQSMQPTRYRSTLIALSSKQTSQTGNFGKLLGLSIGGSSDDTIFSILKSRRMRKDINEHFKLKDRPQFWWSLDAYIVTGGFAVEVTGSDSGLIKDIANFAAGNVDEINKDLKITTEIGIVKVLDPALEGVPIGRSVSKKVIVSALFVFLLYTLFIFFREYFSHLKGLRK